MSKYEIVDNGDGTSTVAIPLKVRNIAIQAGGVEILAKSFGWTPQIEVKEEDDVTFKTIDNPVSALDACGDAIKDLVAELFRKEFVKIEVSEATVSADEKADELLGVQK